MGAGVELAEIVDAELVEDGTSLESAAASTGTFVDHNTVLRPGQEIPTDSDGPRYTERGL